jgi:hypothetical protein
MEEHEECTCQCLGITPSHCIRPELFNNDTCSCACDMSVYLRDKLQCDTSYSDRKWDERTCTCRQKDQVMSQHPADESGSSLIGSDHEPMYDPPVAPQNCHECLSCLSVHGSVDAMGFKNDYITRNSWTVLGFCLVCISFLSCSTVFFWRKAKQLSEESTWSSEGEDPSYDPSPSPGPPPQVIVENHHHKVKVRSPTSKLERNGKKRLSVTKANSLDELEAKQLVVADDEEAQVVAKSMMQTNSLGRSLPPMTGTTTKIKKPHKRKRKPKPQPQPVLIDQIPTGLITLTAQDLAPSTTTFQFGDELDPNFAS